MVSAARDVVDGLVSVVMPAYDRAATIGPAVRSVLAQTYGNLELLVVDDGSRDGTAEVVEELAAGDPRLRLIRLPANEGRSAARNRGIDEARGEFVTFIDSDDLYAPGRLERLVAAARRFPSEDFFIDDVMQFAQRDGRWILRNRTVYPSGVWRPRPPHRVWIEGYLRWSGASKPFVRRSLLDTHGMRFPSDMSQAEDQCFTIELIFSGTTRRPVRVAESLYWYRRPYEYRADAGWLLDSAVRAIELALDRTGNPDLVRLAPRLIRHFGRNPDDGDPKRRFSLRSFPRERIIFTICWLGARVVDLPVRGRIRDLVEAALGSP